MAETVQADSDEEPVEPTLVLQLPTEAANPLQSSHTTAPANSDVVCSPVQQNNQSDSIPPAAVPTAVIGSLGTALTARTSQDSVVAATAANPLPAKPLSASSAPGVITDSVQDSKPASVSMLRPSMRHVGSVVTPVEGGGHELGLALQPVPTSMLEEQAGPPTKQSSIWGRQSRIPAGGTAIAEGQRPLIEQQPSILEKQTDAAGGQAGADGVVGWPNAEAAPGTQQGAFFGGQDCTFGAQATTVEGRATTAVRQAMASEGLTSITEGQVAVHKGQGSNPDGQETVSDACCVCQSGQDGEIMLLCDKCDQPAHLGCAGVEAVPEGDWFCPFCTAVMVRCPPVVAHFPMPHTCASRPVVGFTQWHSIWQHES